LHCISQRRGVMPLVLLLMRSGIELVQVGEHRLLHQLGVQRRDAVDRECEPTKGQLGPCARAAAVLVDQRHGANLRSSSPACPRLGEHLGVDRVDDLHVARQQPLDQRHRPASSASGSSVWLV
jgi:hypothetical protein